MAELVYAVVGSRRGMGLSPLGQQLVGVPWALGRVVRPGDPNGHMVEGYPRIRRELGPIFAHVVAC